MASARVHDIAKKLGVKSAEAMAALAKLGVKVKSHSSSIDQNTIDKLTKALKKTPEKKAAPKKASEKKTPEKKAEKIKLVVQKKAPVRKTAKKKTVKAKPAPAAAPPEPAKVVLKPRLKKIGPPRKKPDEEVVKHKTAAPTAAGAKAPKKVEKAAVAEKEEKPRAKPTMQKAFKAIRKIESRKFHPTFKKHGRQRGGAKSAKTKPTVTAPRKKSLKIQEGATVKEFSELIGMKFSDIVKKFMELGYMPTINQAVDMDAALIVAEALGVKLEIESIDDETTIEETPSDIAKRVPRAPIVTVMGHVDHGKTSLLDSIRETKVIETEAGGITQHIGAYKVNQHGKDIVFLDTPGHEAFTALRARGAKVTDIVVLIVAADDGVKPQTVEAIDHAKAAGVPIIVAINKIDKPAADPARVRTELAEHEILSEDWGGKHIFVEISAKQHTGIDNLLEMILIQAEMMELKANPEKMARGVIIEARLDKGRGPIATVLVQTGSINVGDAFVSGINHGRVRILLDDSGKKIKSAGPATPAEVIGFGSVPTSGDAFAVLENEKKARQIAIARLNKQKSRVTVKMPRMSLEDLYEKIKEGQVKDLNIIIKGDVHGSIEAFTDAFSAITHEEVKINIIHTGVGGINESDAMLAAASNAIIIGFNVRPDTNALQAASREGVDVRLYSVIYEAIDDVKKALEGLLEPTFIEKLLGRAEVRQTFHASRLGTIAGSYVTEGMISRACDGIRLLREGVVVHEGKLSSVKRFKDDVKEVQSGYECGITIENFNDIKVGDIIENFIMEKVAGKL